MLRAPAVPRPSLFDPQRVGLVVLLVLELLLLTVTFDTQSLDTIPSVWARLIGWSPQILRLGITVVLATLLFSGQALLRINWERESSTRDSSRLASLLVHGCALVGFVWTSTIVMGAQSTTSLSSLLALLWLMTGFITLAAWGLAVLPLEQWIAAANSGRSSILLGITVGTLVWASGFITEELWQPLAGYTFTVVAWMLGAIYATTVNNPASLEIGTPTFAVTISPQCSGYEGVGLILAFMSTYLWFFRRELKFPHALLLLPMGAAAIWIVNAVRIVALIVIGTSGWRAIAMGGFHSQAGWLAFNAVGLGLVAVTMRGRYFAATPSSPRLVAAESAATPAYLAPFLALTLTAMVTAAMSADFQWLYPLRMVTVGAVLWTFRKTYAGFNWTWSWQAIAIGAVTSVVWIALLPEASSRNEQWPIALQSVSWYWAAAWLAARMIGYVVAAPLAEELAFRGFLPRRLARTDFEQVPIGTYSFWTFVISSVVFGALHGGLWLPGTVAGMAFALALYRRRELADAVVAHATTNALIALYAVSTGQWSVWS